MRVAIVNDSRKAFHYGSILVMDNLESLLKKYGHEIVWTWPIGVDWRKHVTRLATMPAVDVVIINAEGVIHHGPRRWQAQALVEFQEYAQYHLKVPVFLVNATLYENDESVYAHLRKFDGIYVRDVASQHLLRDKNIISAYVPDLTFAIPSQLHHQPSQELCVIDSVQQSDVPHLKRFAKERNGNFQRITVARPGKYSCWKRPRKFLLESARWLFKDRKKSLDPREFEAKLSACGFVVTGRYHAVTLCMKHRIPFVALESNTPKIAYLLNDVFGNTHRTTRLEDLDSLKIEDWQHYSDTEIEHLDRYLLVAIQANHRMLHEIASRIDTKN